MKTTKYTLGLIALLSFIFSLDSCGNDSKGRLLIKNLTTSSGSLNFAPMMRSDSASVRAFKPQILLYNGKPYTGAVAQYDQYQKLLIEGYVKNGLMDSTWKFYFASGGLRMEGKYTKGIDVGLWQSYYGYGKHKITKLYDNYGYMLMRIEYYDNGNIKNYQNVKAPMFGNKERNFDMDKRGQAISLYIEDSVLMLKQGDTIESVGKNVFLKGTPGYMDIAK